MDWNAIIKAVVEGLGPLLTAGIVALIGFGIKYLIEQIRSINNATVQAVAEVAVRYVETHFGPDSGTGLAKKAEAADFLSKKIAWLKHEDAVKFIDAAYDKVFTEITRSPLVQGVALSSITPSASSGQSKGGN